MRITDELREYTEEQIKWLDMTKVHYRKFFAIADRIDAEHEEALREAYVKGCEEGMGMANAKDAQAEYLSGRNEGYDEGWDAGFASADDWLAQHEDAMAEHGWVRLPKDADGEYWFCGDKIMLPDGNVVEIIGIGGDWLYYCVASVAMTVFGRIRAHNVRHYHAPTIEDVLREFTQRLDDPMRYDRDELVERYVAKLKLADDGKEQ